MPLFWFLAGALLLAALSILVWPLLRPPRAAGVDADAAAIAVFRDQKRAVDADFDSGAITSAERDVVLGDLAQRVAEEVGGSTRPTGAVVAARPAWPLAIVLLLSIPVLAIALYRQLGDPGAVATVAVVDAAARGHDASDTQIAAMIDALARRLEQHPDDAEGWALLARSNYALGRFRPATEAFAKATALIQDNPDLLADYADAQGMLQDRSLAGRPLELVERALAIDPNHPKALALAATAAMDAREADKAIAYWRRLAAQLPPGSDEARQVAGVIAQLGGAPSPAAGSARVPSPQAGGEASTGGTIGGRVALSPSFAAKVSPTDTVYIFARATNGPRMPLAALRIPAVELPKDFKLDDSMGMAGGMKLSSASEVVVEARISKSGNALSQPGDLFGRSAPAKPGTAGLRITIDQVVP